jgi:hypothetical protein
MDTNKTMKSCTNCGKAIKYRLSCDACDSVKYCTWRIEETHQDPQARIEFCKDAQSKSLNTWQTMKDFAVKNNSRAHEMLYKYFRRIIYPLHYNEQGSILARTWNYAILRAEIEIRSREKRETAQREAMQAVNHAMDGIETHRDAKKTQPERAYAGFDASESEQEESFFFDY